MRKLVPAFLLCLTAVVAWTSPVAGDTQDELNSRIPAAQKAKYVSIRHAKDWQNPYLIVLVAGIDIRSKAIPSGRKTVSPSELGRALVALPVSAWPYGRVVAIQENSLRAPGDDESIGRNARAAVEVLKRLRLEISWWPSA